MATETKNTIAALSAQAMAPMFQKRAAATKKKYKPEYSRFKCKCYYKDGNTGVFYSYDTHHKYKDGQKTIITNESEGLTKLLTYIHTKQHAIKTAVIWATFQKESGTDTARYDNEIYKGVNKNNTFETLVNRKLHFNTSDNKNNFYLNTDILKLQLMAEMEGGKK